MNKTLTTLFLSALAIVTTSCGGSDKNAENANATETADFYATQPVKSGQYTAVNYNIDKNGEVRKGKFDGRILIALDPDRSGMYIYENGNRVKIDYRVMLSAPFSKVSDGHYMTTDNLGDTITMATDSAVYTLTLKKKTETVNIGFDPKAISEGTAASMWERISKELSKK